MSNDVLVLAPSGKEERAERYKLVLKAHEKRKRNEARREQVKTGALILAGALVIGLGFENYHLARKAELVNTVYAVIRDDGTLVNSERFTDVADKIQNKTELNSLWDYVTSRECYNSGTVARSYYVVQAMSDTRVAREYREWFSKSNPESPQKRYGAKGITVQCEFESVAPSGDDDGFIFRFYRWETWDRGGSAKVLYAAPLRYRTGIYASDPKRGWVDKVTFNAAGVQVWEYPGAHPAPVSANVAQAGGQ